MGPDIEMVESSFSRFDRKSRVIICRNPVILPDNQEPLTVQGEFPAFLQAEKG